MLDERSAHKVEIQKKNSMAKAMSHVPRLSLPRKAVHGGLHAGAKGMESLLLLHPEVVVVAYLKHPLQFASGEMMEGTRLGLGKKL